MRGFSKERKSGNKLAAFSYIYLSARKILCIAFLYSHMELYSVNEKGLI